MTYVSEGFVNESLFSCRRKTQRRFACSAGVGRWAWCGPLRDLYRIIVDEGNSYPHDRFPDQDDFMDYYPSPNTP